jgi:tellurite resistance protein TehA-like permease
VQISNINKAIENLHPAYFAVVMATGIVSVDCHLFHFELLANALFVVNILAFTILSAMTIIRAVKFRPRFLSDVVDHNKSVGFFSMPAAICVLGSQFVLLAHNYSVATIFWIAGICLWLGFTYLIFTILTVKETKPPLSEGINGGWLLAVVATQAVSNLGGLLAPHFGDGEQLILFYSLIMWLCGGMLYIWMISLIFYRYTFFKFAASDLAPPYWINMGAVAISTLAGTRLIANASHFPLLTQLLPFLQGFSLLFWATATWWIPMLVTLAAWRHICKRFPVSYDPLYWGLVFPLGMYTASTFQLAQATGLSFLFNIPRYFIFIALAAWCITFMGLAKRIVANLLQRETPPQSLPAVGLIVEAAVDAC